MTGPAPLPTDEDVRRVVDDLRAVVQVIAGLPALAPADDVAARRWAGARAASVEQTWSQLQPAMVAGDALIFGAGIQALLSETVPLGDAPPSMVGTVDAVRTHLERLAVDTDALLDPHTTQEGISPAAQAALAESLRRIAPG